MTEGQHVKQGDVLFEIDPVPFQLSVAQAKATLEQAHTSYDNLVANIKIYGQMLELAQQGVELKQRDVDRKTALVKNNVGSQLDLDNRRTRLSPQARRRNSSSSNSPTQKPSCSVSPICRLSSFRRMSRPRRHSIRPNATSTTP